MRHHDAVVPFAVGLALAAAPGCGGEASDASPPASSAPTVDSAEPSPTSPTTTSSSTITTPSVVILDDPPVEVPADLEVLATSGVEAAAVVDLSSVLVSQGDDLWSIDAVGEASVLQRDTDPVLAAAPWGDAWLLSTATELQVWDGAVLSPTALHDVVGPVSRVRSRDDDLWMAAEAGLRLWRDGQVFAVTVDDDELGAFALGGDVRGDEVVWAARGDEVHGLGNSGQVWVDLEAVQLAAEVDSVAVDAQRTAWAAAGGWLYRRDVEEGWLRYDLGASVWEVWGHSDAPGVWVEGDGQWWFTDGELWEAPTGLPAPSALNPPQVDAAGRLLLRDEAGGLVRASTTRPLVVVGLEEGAVVARPVDVQLVPTAPDAVQALSAELVDAAGTGVSLVVDPDTSTVTVDPDGLAAGPWTFRATAEYGGRTSVSERSIFLGADFEPTWAADVYPLYEAECAVCHGGDAQTVLDEPEQWEALIDDILFNVREGNMPLGGDPLSDLDVVTIEAWRDAGFPR